MKRIKIKIKGDGKQYKCTSCRRVTNNKDIILSHVEKCVAKIPTIYEFLKKGKEHLIYNNKINC